jgi:type I restriction enzyme, S subunit
VSWRHVKISTFGRVVTGKTPPTSNREFFGGEYFFVTPSDIDYSNFYCRRTETTVTEVARERFTNQFIPGDAVIFTCIGNTIGKCALAPADCLTNQQMNSIVANEETDSKFVYYLLCNSVEFIRQFGGGAATPIINKTTFENIQLSAPEFHEQKRIGSLLSAYDELIENNRRRMRLLEEAARLLYREWFVRFRFPGHEHTRIVEDIPQDWTKTTVYNAVDILSGGTPKTTNADYWDGEIPFYTPKDASDGIWVTDCERTITEAGLNNCNSRLYPKETIFISARGTVGKTNMAQCPMAMSQSCYALVGKDGVTQAFLFHAIQAAVESLRQQAGGAVFDAIIVDTFKRIPLLIPEPKMVRLFDDVARPILAQIENLTLQNQKLRAARDLLLRRLMSGQIEVLTENG